MLVEATVTIEARSGTHGSAARPVRRCIVTGEHAPRARLLRFVVSPEGVLTPDVAARLPGRGAWVAPDAAVLGQAIKRKLFARAFHGPVAVPDDLVRRVEALLARRLVDGLSLARRAGRAVAGAEKVEARVALWARAGRPGLVALARDAGADARKRRRSLPDGAVLIDALDGEEIGQAFGRPRAAQAAVDRGALMDRLIDDAFRLSGFRPAAAAVERDGE